ncbi:MAG: PP2C family serine/threonine-protein phosphatase [Leptolyngbyaceae cyanobacterium]
MPRRLLWAVGYQADTFKPGDVLSGRYLCQASRIFLDQQPGIPPGTLADVPKAVLPYLHLVSYQVHLPQVYGWVDAELSSGEVTRLMLLENAALLSTVTAPTQSYPVDPSRITQPDPSPKQIPCLLPSLHRAWPHAPAGQQLNWLWQMARLWSPLAAEQVAATLLKEKLIRVEGPLIRLLELRFGLNTAVIPSLRPDDSPSAMSAPTLVQLGAFWGTLMDQAAPEIREFGQSLCQHLVAERLTGPDMLQDILMDGIHQVGRSHTLQVRIATQTDKGPSRSGNEDACFPPEGSVVVLQDALTAEEDSGLAIVCDGIGGHQGGAIASDLAIKTIAQQISQSTHRLAGIAAIQADLKQTIAQANDVISQSNDDKQRRDRQRMGTTVVMGLLHGRDCYITHVGDSRAYWVTQWGCHQITLDDDVVSRETRLGYGTYRNILYQPNSGALVQALGMGPSRNLYPTVQRLMLEGEGLLLLCSDGLSDQDLIEACWEEVLRPVLLEEESDLGMVSQQLVDLANTHNGHDNVTVGLIHWQIRQTTPVQVNGAIDLSAFITQEMEIDRTAPRRRPITGLSPLPDSQEISQATQSQEMRGISSITPTAGDRPFRAQTGTHLQETDLEVQPQLASPDQTPQADSSVSTDAGMADSAAPTIGLERLSLDSSSPNDALPNAPDEPVGKTDQPPDSSPSTSPWVQILVLIVAIASLGMAGLLAYIWVPAISDRVNAILDIEAPTRPRDEGTSDLDGPDGLGLPSDTDPAAEPSLGIGSVVQLQALPTSPPNPETPSPDSSMQPPLQLLALDSTPDEALSSVPPAQVLGTVPWGSVLIITGSFEVPAPDPNVSPTDGAMGDTMGDMRGSDRTPNSPPPSRSSEASSLNANSPDTNPPTTDRPRPLTGEREVLLAGRWLEVQLCVVPTTGNAPASVTSLAPGAIGWVPESTLRSLTQKQFDPSMTPPDLCPLPSNPPLEASPSPEAAN